MQHPYQCIACVDLPVEAAKDGYLAAACGPNLMLVNVAKGDVVSEWSAAASANATSNGNDDDTEPKERPAKKQKISNSMPHAPNIIKLTVSPNQIYVVAVTDDKFIHVFSVTGQGELRELSQRCMPKRPCAIQVLPDNATIICGDKFGDVYSLPLLPTEPAAETVDTESATPGAEVEDAVKKDEAAFKPSATNLTVHTKRNRKALESQMKQKDFTAKKEPLKFEHKLLLGHVSMLTDVAYATRKVDGKERGYIVTADRDEHIRISRGPPQSHIIEGYCLGHKEFISKMCLIPGNSMLVSGGGDDELYVWDWPSFNLRRKYPIYEPMVDALTVGVDMVGPTAKKAAEKVERKVVVSGLWTAPFTNQAGKQETALLVACEGVPALFIIPVNRLQLKKSKEITELNLEFPPLDVTCVGETVLVSLDGRSEGYPPIQAYTLKHGDARHKGNIQTKEDTEMLSKLKCLTSMGARDKLDDKALDDLLYGVANLRKRRGWDAPGDTTAGAEMDPNGMELDPNATEVVEMEDDLTVRKL